MALLARVADRLYWAARYLERAEDTARIIRAYHDLVVDFPGDVMLRWEPLAAICGNAVTGNADVTGDHTGDDDSGELAVLQFLIADRLNPGSVASCVSSCRENLRTTREVIPRESWLTINQLSHYVASAAPGAVRRQSRDRFLARVIDDSRGVDGVLDSTMTRASPYRLFRLGRLLERADMTTRVLGVRAAALLQMEQSGVEPLSEEVQWMGVLRSLSALQMYQRATKGPIDGEAVVRFLLYYATFPRSVQGCLDEIRSVLVALPTPHDVITALDGAQKVLLDAQPMATDGHELDDAMDRVQIAIAGLDAAIAARFFH
ncbi:MAG TPA: alpha-E domain-containing protein [Ilumatobacteraceae bacterium]|nr:alpha-E domain-containing protein [Ilumatobacteraceae bacterium]